MHFADVNTKIRMEPSSWAELSTGRWVEGKELGSERRRKEKNCNGKGWTGRKTGIVNV